jgi:hypothetical protein
MARLNQIGNHKTVVYTENGYTFVKYHSTNVVKFSDKRIVLDSGGWQTATTKTRMNQTANQFDLEYKVFQDNFEWYVDFRGRTYEFCDKMQLLR